MLSDVRQAELLKFAEALADVARSVLIPAHADPDTRLEIKPDGTPVTWADKEAEVMVGRYDFNWFLKLKKKLILKTCGHTF